MIITALFSFICTYAITYLVLKCTVFNYWKKRNVPFVKPQLIFGNIWEVISLKRSWCNFIKHIQKHCNTHGYMGIFIMFWPALVVNDLEIIKDILIKDFDYFKDNWYQGDRKIDPVIGSNPFVLKGKEWKETRNLFTSQFTTAKMKLICPQLQKVCIDMIQYLTSEISLNKSKCIELADLSRRFAIDAVMSCGYSLQGSCFLHKTPDVFKITESSADAPGKIITYKHTLGLFQFFSKLFKVTFYGDPVPKIFYDIILNATNYRIENNKHRSDLLNHFIELRNNKIINDIELVGHSFTLFLDGVQTFHAVMVYSLLELSLNPHIQEAARNEVETVLLKYSGEISFEAYKDLHYIENVILETLRKYPVIAVMSKVCTQPYVMQDLNNGTSFTIQKGTSIFWSVQAIHNNPKYYPDPNKFDPDRFTENVKETRPKYSFLGFGDGPRICIGKKYALVQLVFALAAILPAFDLHFNKKTKLPIVHDNFHFFDVPENGIYLDFVPRCKEHL